ncbi:MAG: c-type cytochrome, partial [Gammaproteobacteria bacterium]|nr:c-type cytochrome [Gammaproteobacteria bacterium]
MRRMLVGVLVLAAQTVHAQHEDGAAIYDQHCATCHAMPPDKTIPPRAVLAAMAPNAVVEALTTGNMRVQGAPLTNEQRVAVAEYLTGGTVTAAVNSFSQGMCENISPMSEPMTGQQWTGWSPDERNQRAQLAT